MLAWRVNHYSYYVLLCAVHNVLLAMYLSCGHQAAVQLASLAHMQMVRRQAARLAPLTHIQHIGKTVLALGVLGVPTQSPLAILNACPAVLHQAIHFIAAHLVSASVGGPAILDI